MPRLGIFVKNELLIDANTFIPLAHVATHHMIYVYSCDYESHLVYYKI